MPHGPAVRRAIEYLRTTVASQPPRLPSIRILAADAGVSHVTMLKAAHALASEGLLNVVKGQGVSVAGKRNVPGPPSGPKWRQLTRHIERDIVLGVFEPGRPLPQLKQLVARYGVDYRTLKRSLEALAAEGSLGTYGGTYHLSRLTTARQKLGGAAGRSPSRATVLFITHGTGAEGFRSEDPRYGEFLSVLERESILSDFRLRLVGSDGGEEWLARHPREPVIGHMVSFSSVSPLPEWYARLLSYGLPLAVATTGTIIPQVHSPNRRLLKVFYTGATETPGRDVAEYLVGLGHRRIAYICPYHRAGWSQARLRALRDVCATAGFGDAVQAFVKSEHTSNIEYLGAAESRPEPGEAPFPDVGRAMPELLRAHVSDARRIYRELFRDREILNYCIPLFESALASPDITAWVCSIDYIALFALDFLQSRAVDVPRQISLIGFDDLQGARERTLSTYRFDMQTMARNMVSHVLNPDYGPLKRSPERMEVGGMVIERATTGPAPGV